MGLGMCQINCIPTLFLRHTFSSLHAADTVAFQHFPAQGVLVFSKQLALRRCKRISEIADGTVHSSNPYSAAPIILNGTETSRHCTETVCVRLSFHHRWPATFQRVAKHHEQGKQATHLAGGEEEGEGTSEDAHGWVLCGVQNFNNEGRGRRRLVLVFLVGRRVLSCCWRGPPHHRLPRAQVPGYVLKYDVSPIGNFGVIRFSSQVKRQAKSNLDHQEYDLITQSIQSSLASSCSSFLVARWVSLHQQLLPTCSALSWPILASWNDHLSDTLNMTIMHLSDRQMNNDAARHRPRPTTQATISAARPSIRR